MQDAISYRAFLCHSSEDSDFVLRVAKYLKRNLDGIFYYEDFQHHESSFVQTINTEINESNIMVVFAGAKFTEWQIEEVTTAIALHHGGSSKSFFVINLPNQDELPESVAFLATRKAIPVLKGTEQDAYDVAKEIVRALNRKWLSADDLPLDPHLFSYEKDIIKFYLDKKRYRKYLSQPIPPEVPPEIKEKIQEKNFEITDMLLRGCPATWPTVNKWPNDPDFDRPNQISSGEWRPQDARVVAAALTKYHTFEEESFDKHTTCLMNENLCFLEAGPREHLSMPLPGRDLRVAVLVSGGIAPGINAVIDGIAQRHFRYAETQNYQVTIWGLKNGFRAFDDLQRQKLRLVKEPSPLSDAIVTSDYANEGGSIIGTSRVRELLAVDTREERLHDIVRQLRYRQINILYVIGGDGSMKAAHAIWHYAKELEGHNDETRLSVVAIPKTMDNDILWVWQTFGFLSAVEKAREVIETLGTEAKSNPRLCIVQLFGSDSGFVVSHTVLASRTGICDAALIPEIKFSMDKLAKHIKEKISRRGKRIPSGLIVLAETAVPTDAMRYADEERLDYIDLGLSDDEKKAIKDFDEIREKEQRIQGQTNDFLRNAGLKIVKEGLKKLLPEIEIDNQLPEDTERVDWEKLRVFANEPRHLLRAISPTCSDIIFGHRLGTLAVDNALAGYTDFMISQWLTEYTMVPLQLVAMGRKRIPERGVFWNSVLAKTGQPSNLD